jgi:N-acetylneuraminate synthase
MSPWSEIDAVVGRVKEAGRAFAVLQCTSRYPTPLEAVGLNVIAEMHARYAAPAGLSDHSGRPASAIAAIARGADVLELHLTLDRGLFGPDVSSSLTVPEFRQVSEFREALGVMDANPVDKDKVAAELAGMRAAFRRSLAPRRALAAGTVLTADMLAAKKPGTGIPEADLPRLIGHRVVRDVTPDRLLRWDDLETSK